MRKPRTYQWTEPSPFVGDLRVTAEVSGAEYPGSWENPPEHRECVVTIERRFCPSEPDKCGGCEWEDVTDQYFGSRGDRMVWEEFTDQMRDKGLDRDDDAMQAAYDEAHEYNPEEDREYDIQED